MHALIVLAHPSPDSFNGHLAALAADSLVAAGWSVQTSDLYRERFDPCEDARHYRERRDPARFDVQAEQRHAVEHDALPADVAGEMERVMRADLLVLQFPLWWHAPPAMLKGWFDRVLVYGGMYTGTRRYDRGVCAGKRAMLSVTAGAPESTFAYNGRSGDIDLLLWPTHFSLNYVGFQVLEPVVCAGVEGELRYSADDTVRARLARHEQSLATALRNIDQRTSIPFNGLDEYDPDGRLEPGAPGYSHFIRTTP